MTNERRDDPVHLSIGTAPDRRGMLAMLLAVGGAHLTAGSSGVAIAKKKRKRCKKKKKCPPGFLTCGDIGCDAGCTFCYDRNAGSALCGETLNIPGTCSPCASDNDCVGTTFPYCVIRQVTLSSGTLNELSCPGHPLGLCGRPNAC